MKRLGRVPRITLVLAVDLVVLLTLLVPETVSSVDDLGAVRFGLPFAWLEQDLSRLTPPAEWFPNRIRAMAPQEAPTRILWGELAGSFLSVLAPLALIGWVGGRGNR